MDRIDLRTPLTGNYEGRGFGRRFVWAYKCSQGHTVRVRASAFRGNTPEPGIGAIVCPQCPTPGAPR